MEQAVRTLKGQIINKETKKGLPQLGIEAWLNTKVIEQKLGASVTDASGKFSIQIDIDDDTFNKAALLFKVYRGDTLVHNTPFNELPDGTTLDNIIIPVELPEPDDKWRIQGHVRKVNGEPVATQVQALNINLKGNQPLGQAVTEDGF